MLPRFGYIHLRISDDDDAVAGLHQARRGAVIA